MKMTVTLMLFAVACFGAESPQAALAREIDPKVRETVRDAVAAALVAENEYLRAVLAAEERKATLVRAIEARKTIVADVLKSYPGCTLDAAARLQCEKDGAKK